MTLRVIVADDEAGQRTVVAEILRDAGYDTEAYASGADALAAVRDRGADLLVTDLRMPGMSGVELLAAAREHDPGLHVVLMTAFASVDSAVEAMKLGAFDYLQKPFSKDELIARVARVADRVALVAENQRLRRELTESMSPPILGDSEPIRRLLSHIERVAKTTGDVLVTGESGTGKELVARRLHATSGRAGGPFVAVNCAAIPESLAESELFGHEKGAFTHAVSARAGHFEEANGGTLFLDEISSMPVPIQAKLLRVIQEREVQRVGGSTARAVDVRIVSATNLDLRERIGAGEFREDLYHRLNVLELHLPPLRDRTGDIPTLAAHFRDVASARYDVPAPELTPPLLEFFAEYPFPGNVRELSHIIEKMVVLSDGESLGLDDLPPSVDVGAPPRARVDTDAGPEHLLDDGPVSLVDVERRLIGEAIRKANGNFAEAAKLVGVSYKTFRYRARKFGLDR